MKIYSEEWKQKTAVVLYGVCLSWCVRGSAWRLPHSSHAWLQAGWLGPSGGPERMGLSPPREEGHLCWVLTKLETLGEGPSLGLWSQHLCWWPVGLKGPNRVQQRALLAWDCGHRC